MEWGPEEKFYDGVKVMTAMQEWLCLQPVYGMCFILYSWSGGLYRRDTSTLWIRSAVDKRFRHTERYAAFGESFQAAMLLASKYNFCGVCCACLYWRRQDCCVCWIWKQTSVPMLIIMKEHFNWFLLPVLQQFFFFFLLNKENMEKFSVEFLQRFPLQTALLCKWAVRPQTPVRLMKVLIKPDIFNVVVSILPFCFTSVPWMRLSGAASVNKSEICPRCENIWLIFQQSLYMKIIAGI